MTRHPSHRGIARRGPSGSTRRVEIRRILLWSGICNLVLTSVFMWTMLQGYTGLAGSPAQSPLTPAADGTHDPLANSRPLRSDQETGVRGPRFSDKRKGPLAFTRIPVAMASALAAERISDISALQAGREPALDEPVAAEEARGLRIGPVLRKNPQSGKLEIGSFSPLTFAGSSDECLELGQSMLEFADSSPDSLEILSSSGAITIARICAANGSVVITCRNEEITLSPRRTRPSDQC